MKRRVCVVTGSRAEYGLLRWVMQGIREAPELDLQTVVTGMHLAPEFGDTWREIELDGFPIDRKIEMLLGSDTPTAVAKSVGLGTIGFSDALQSLAPHLLLVLGDRFEILSAVTAALFLRIPVAHLHGGELTEGAFDDAIRHAITKMSHLHFVAADEYRQRVLQLGEDPARVHLVGATGLDVISRLPLLDRAALEESLEFKLGARSLLVTFHPATLDEVPAGEQMDELLAAVDSFRDTQLVFTMPNADTAARGLHRQTRDFVAGHPNARAFTSLGQLRYLSCMRHVDAVIGNSSSGLIEAPAMGTATVNIGDRQKGRLRAGSVIDCAPDRAAIVAAISRACSPEFQACLDNVRLSLGDGKASERIVAVLKSASLDGITRKTFRDLPTPTGADASGSSR